jgi:hypothetical protein
MGRLVVALGQLAVVLVAPLNEINSNGQGQGRLSLRRSPAVGVPLEQAWISEEKVNE